MLGDARLRWLAGQFARPSGAAGRWLIGPWLDRISEPINRLVLERLEVGARHDVLEVGFGGGAMLGALLGRTSGRVLGVDASPAMVARARRRFAGEARLSLHLASAERLPLPDASVDRVCAVETLYFWPDPAAGLKEIARVLRQGGRFAIGFEPPEELRRWAGHRFGFRLFKVPELGRMMSDAGFEALFLADGTGRRPAHFHCLTGERTGGVATQ